MVSLMYSGVTSLTQIEDLQAPLSLSDTPIPADVTLFLKIARHTVVLSVPPSTPFTEVARLLLLVLHSRNIKSIDDISIPTADQGNLVQFGVPRDVKDLKKGFTLLVSKNLVINNGKESKKRGSKTGQNQQLEVPALMDGSVLAFRFRSATDEQMDDSDDADPETVDGKDDAGWNVEVPVLEEIE